MPRHFPICMLTREAPTDRSAASVVFALPGADLDRQGIAIDEAAIQALPGQYADFDFGHIQPTRVFGCVVKPHTFEQARSGALAEHILKAFSEVSVQVVQHQMDATCRPVDLLDQMLNEGHEVRLAAMIGDCDGALAGFGLDRPEQVEVPRRMYS